MYVVLQVVTNGVWVCGRSQAKSIWRLGVSAIHDSYYILVSPKFVESSLPDDHTYPALCPVPFELESRRSKIVVYTRRLMK